VPQNRHGAFDHLNSPSFLVSFNLAAEAAKGTPETAVATATALALM